MAALSPAVGCASDTFLETNIQLESQSTSSARGVLSSRKVKDSCLEQCVGYMHHGKN